MNESWSLRISPRYIPDVQRHVFVCLLFFASFSPLVAKETPLVCVGREQRRHHPTCTVVTGTELAPPPNATTATITCVQLVGPPFGSPSARTDVSTAGVTRRCTAGASCGVVALRNGVTPQ